MTRCPKCSGLLVPDVQEYPLEPTVKCLNCGWFDNKPLALTPELLSRNGKRKGGAQLAGSTNRSRG